MAKARLVLLDTVGAILGGAGAPELVLLAGRLPAGGAAVLLGGGRRAAPRDAALWNGTAGSVLELYEGSRFTRGPTAIQVLPAALAEAERRRADGGRLLVALVAGYEVAARFARAGRLRELHHPSGTWGVMGAAAAAAHLRGADAATLTAVIDLAGSLCLTTSLDTVREGATVRNAYAGTGNLLGLLAADLAVAGFGGLPDGAARVYGGLLCEGFDASVLDRRADEPFEIERGYFKVHACYRHSHAALDALGAVLTRHRPDPAAVRAVAVHTYGFAARLTNRAPRTTLAAQFSIPHALAARLVLGGAGPEAFGPESLADARVARLRALVTVLERGEYTAMLPDRRPATVEVTLADGRVLTETVALPRGEPENPLDPEELDAKFRRLAAPRLGPGGAEALGEALRHVERAGDVRRLFAGAAGPAAGIAPRGGGRR